MHKDLDSQLRRVALVFPKGDKKAIAPNIWAETGIQDMY